MITSANDTAGLTEPALRLMVEAAPDILVLLQPDGRCRHVSSASMPLLGHPPNVLSGANLRDLVLDDDQHAVSDLLDRLGTGEPAATVALRMRRAGGGWVWMEGNARRAPAGAGIVVALRDITARKQGEAVLEEANSLLRRRASEDPATGLANRGHFTATLERELRRARRDGIALAVLAADLDGFSLFVDLYGYEAGEDAIRRAAECAGDVLRRPGDLAGRLSAGALGIMLPATVMAGATEVARRLKDAIAAIRIEHAGLLSGIVTVSVGAVCSVPNSQATELVEAAEHAARLLKATAHAPADLREHLLYFLPLPQGHGSLRPMFRKGLRTGSAKAPCFGIGSAPFPSSSRSSSESR